MVGSGETMKSDEVIDLLRHYRHDLLNHLQLIKGYASMNKLDKVKEKIDQGIVLSRQEAKLSDLNCPAFALWVIQFNWQHENFKLQYQVDGDNVDLSSIDSSLYAICEEMMDMLSNNMDPTYLYETYLHIHHQQKTTIKFEFIGDFEDSQSLKSALLTKTFIKDVNIIKEDKNMFEIVMEIEKKR